MTMTLSGRTPGEDAAARDTARILLDIGAVNFRPEQPYILTSGRASPVYIDCRRVISFPAERGRIVGHAVAAVTAAGSSRPIAAVAGGETAGIPYSAWIADRMNLPMLYVRKEPKGFGRMAQIEGHMADNCHTLLVEDLATDGGSKINFVNAIRKAGGTVDRVFVVFYYGIFPEALDTLEDLDVKLVWLATWVDVIEAAAEAKTFDTGKIAAVRAYLDDPHGWSAAHGGKGA
ncbi:MAG: orotate phosphoribosyltransferase [Alphaproteobacteria bacterium]|nr:orotate phosphoribosyltransferase [Alphaproteobacteria bacterium]